MSGGGIAFRIPASEKVILLNDGQPSSVYAIRTFSYLFPFLTQIPVELVTVRGMKESSHLPDNKLMREFMKRHFPNAAYTVLKGTPGSQIVSYIQDQECNAMIVLGAYSGGFVSRFFKLVQKGAQRLRPALLLVPVTMIAYGISTLNNEELNEINAEAREELWLEHSHRQLHVDNYLQWAPAAAVYGLILMG